MTDNEKVEQDIIDIKLLDKNDNQKKSSNCFSYFLECLFIICC